MHELLALLALDELAVVLLVGELLLAVAHGLHDVLLDEVVEDVELVVLGEDGEVDIAGERPELSAYIMPTALWPTSATSALPWLMRSLVFCLIRFGSEKVPRLVLHGDHVGDEELAELVGLHLGLLVEDLGEVVVVLLARHADDHLLAAHVAVRVVQLRVDVDAAHLPQPLAVLLRRVHEQLLQRVVHLNKG